MIKYRLILLVLVFVTSCEKPSGSIPKSIEFSFLFDTELRPHSISIDRENGWVYVASYNPSISNPVAKIQRFDSYGNEQKAIDFYSFSNGEYPHYAPIDLCIDNEKRLYVMAKPYYKEDSYYVPFEVYSILQFDLNFDFNQEFVIPDTTQRQFYTSLACSDNFLYATGGSIIKVIAKNGELVSEIIPSSYSEVLDSLSFLYVSDMEISSNEVVYLTGDVPSQDNISGCYIAKLDPESGLLFMTYSQSTGVLAASPNNPGLDIDKDGNPYLVTCDGKSLEVYNSNLVLVKEVDIRIPNGDEDTRPVDAALYNSSIYICDNYDGLVGVYDINY